MGRDLLKFRHQLRAGVAFFLLKILSNYTNLTEKEKIEIRSLKRGECLMFVGESHILTKVEASEEERKIIE